MTRELIVLPGARGEIAVREDGRLAEYLFEEADQGADAILLGRVDRVIPGMKAAFVDIGQEKNGFLPLEERTRSGDFPRLQPGARVPVQIRREAQGVKGAMLTRDLSLGGEALILMPMNRYVGVSGRVTGEKERARLKELGSAIAGGRFGLVMRTASASLPEEEIRREAETLWERWQEIRRELASAPAPSAISGRRTLLDALIDDYLPRGGLRVLTCSPELAERLRGRCEVVLTDDLDAEGLRAERDRALERRVWLKSGGNLVIDECEALTVIDVNTAKYTGQKQLEETILRTNLEACREIARQARLRGLCGILIIDLIDMAEEDHRQRVLEALREAFLEDRVKTVVHGYTHLGLVEMTRKRTRKSLREEMHAYGPERHPAPGDLPGGDGAAAADHGAGGGAE